MPSPRFYNFSHMIVLRPAKSYKLLDECFELYNKGKRVGQRLRGTHYNAIQGLMRLLKKELEAYGSFGLKAGDDKKYLRRLKTNRKQLAKWFKCCEKTAYNRLQRLCDAGFIRKTFHGSNASFAIDINLDLLHLEDTEANTNDNVVDQFSNPLPHMRQSLPHTLSGIPGQVTKEYKELSGLPSADASAPASPETPPECTLDALRALDADTGCHPSSENHADVAAPTAPSKKVAPKKVPPTKAPKTVKAAIAPLSPSEQGRLLPLLHTVWAHALDQLQEFMPGYLVPAEIERGQAVLAEYFVYSNPLYWKAAAKEFMIRIDLAEGWCARRRAAGKVAFIQLPSRYFDHRQDGVFAATKAWYKVHQNKKIVAREDAEVSRALKLYWQSLQPETKITTEEAIRQIRQKLGKLGGDTLYQKFVGKVYTPTPALTA